MNRVRSMLKRRWQVARLRWCADRTMPVTVNLGLSQNGCKRQKHEYLPFNDNILQTFRMCLRSFFIGEPACRKSAALEGAS